MKKIKLGFAVGITATLVVIISDMFNYFTNLGSFAWVAFVLWSFTLALGEKEQKETREIKNIVTFLLGLPAGIFLSYVMIWCPELLSGNLIAKYIIVFLANVVAMFFPGRMTYGAFFGISFTFAGLGIGILPDNILNILKIIVISLIFSVIGIVSPYISEFLNKLFSKEN